MSEARAFPPVRPVSKTRRGWILSAHGDYERAGSHEVFLDGATIYYFVGDEGILGNAKAWKLFYQLTALRPHLEAVHQQAREVSTFKSYVYTAWGAREFASGIFEVGCAAAERPLFPLGPDEGLDLTDIITHAKFPGVLYWLACRSYNPLPKVGARYLQRGLVTRNNLSFRLVSPVRSAPASPVQSGRRSLLYGGDLPVFRARRR